MTKLALLPALIVTLSVYVSAEESRILLPTEPLFAVEDASGWSLGVRYGIDRHDLQSGTGRMDIDVEHLAGRAGCNLLPFLHGSVEIGRCTADLRGNDGDGGFEWTLGLHADLVEHVIRTSPVTGRKEAIRFSVDATYGQFESDFGETNFEWNELTALPQVSYVVNRRGESVWHPYVPESLAMHLGFAFTTIDGEYGRDDVSESSTFGFLAGMDFLTKSGWVAQTSGIFYDNDDRRISLGVGYNF